MSYLISHAQNFEDVILWRALRHMTPGNYIDIGAQSPDIDSVSRLFHEHGWSGLHVDAMEAYGAALKEGRPGDKVVCAAVSNTPGVLDFFAIPSSGLSTNHQDIASRHRDAGFDVQKVSVPAITLDALLDECGFDQVHWLKIDIEGNEYEAIASWHQSPLRPWVVVIESTVPLSQETSFADWEPLLLAKGYEFAYFDGLNRFYVSSAHLELMASFGPGPNVFDNFALSGTANAPFARLLTEEIGRISAEEDELRKTLAIANTTLEYRADTITRLDGELHAARAEIDAVLRNRVGDIAHLELELRAVRAELNVSSAQLKTQNVELKADLYEALNETGRLSNRLESLELEHTQISAKDAAEIAEQARIAHYWWVTAESMRSEIAIIHGSRSWRWTALLRSGSRPHPMQLARRVLKGAVVRAMRFALSRPTLKRSIMRVLHSQPRLVVRLQRFAVRGGLAKEMGAFDMSIGRPVPTNVAQGALSLRATRVLRDLEVAMGKAKD